MKSQAIIELACEILKKCSEKIPRKMAPETGLEPVTRRLIPTRRDSTIEQLFSNPLGRFHPFDLALSGHGQGARWVRLAPDQLPGAIFAGKFAENLVISIV